jgi:hypothetical protein
MVNGCTAAGIWLRVLDSNQRLEQPGEEDARELPAALTRNGVSDLCPTLGRKNHADKRTIRKRGLQERSGQRRRVDGDSAAV